MKNTAIFLACLTAFAANATPPEKEPTPKAPKATAGAMAASTARQSTRVNTKVALQVENGSQAPGAPVVVGGDVEQRAPASSAVSSAPPPAMGTCAASGFGIALQGASAGVGLSSGTGVEMGCDLARDLTILASLGASVDVRMQRACAKPEIAKAYEAAGSTVCKQQPAKASAVTNELNLLP